MAQPARKVVVCGAGFLGKNIAQTLLRPQGSGAHHLQHTVQLTSRTPEPLHALLSSSPSLDTQRLLALVSADITSPATLEPAFSGASVVVSLVGLMNGAPEDFERIQWKGAENVARAAKAAGAKLVHISAIGADEASSIPYARTKALGEKAVFELCPDATVLRPSLVFGPGDGFFARFATLAKFLPFLPVFGGGTSRFQPVYVGDIARAVDIISRGDSNVEKAVSGKIVEAGGPDVFTYKELMELTLKYSNKWRPVVSVPFAVGIAQGAVLEKLPENLFTVTRSQVEQLKSDNIVNTSPPTNHASFKDLLERFDNTSLTPVYDILPKYL